MATNQSAGAPGEPENEPTAFNPTVLIISALAIVAAIVAGVLFT